MNEKVKHRTKPAEPFAQPNAHGHITRSRVERNAEGKETGPLRITPAANGIPAQAYVQWGDEKTGIYHTWERLSDLIPVGKSRS